MVSEEPTDGRCNAQANGGYCENHPMDNGRCRHHGGKTPTKDENPDVGQGEQSGNQNAVSHGLYAETNNFYQEVMSDKQRRLCDEIFQDYCTQFRDRNGEPHQGELSRLFEIAVNHIKIIHSDNWAVDKPEDLDSGNPMVDKGERFNTEGVPYQEYTETVVLKGQQRLRNSDRQWLKDYGLLNDPETQKAEAAERTINAILSESDN